MFVRAITLKPEIMAHEAASLTLPGSDAEVKKIIMTEIPKIMHSLNI
jgi:hypothetical protein